LKAHCQPASVDEGTDSVVGDGSGELKAPQDAAPDGSRKVASYFNEEVIICLVGFTSVGCGWISLMCVQVTIYKSFTSFQVLERDNKLLTDRVNLVTFALRPMLPATKAAMESGKVRKEEILRAALGLGQPEDEVLAMFKLWTWMAMALWTTKNLPLLTGTTGRVRSGRTKPNEWRHSQRWPRTRSGNCC
jgi:hypothetical protein